MSENVKYRMLRTPAEALAAVAAGERVEVDFTNGAYPWADATSPRLSIASWQDWFARADFRARVVEDEGLDAVPDAELPGMWERADFMGGATDCDPTPQPSRLSDAELPCLPPSVDAVWVTVRGERELVMPRDSYYTADQMRAYAQDARRLALAPPQEAVACHRWRRNGKPTTGWMDGPPRVSVDDSAGLDRWEIEMAYTTPPAAAPVQEDLGALREQAKAWNAVCAALSKADPEWNHRTNRGIDNAVLAISRLSAPVQGVEVDAVERVARVLCKAAGSDPDSTSAENWHDFADTARAALAAAQPGGGFVVDRWTNDARDALAACDWTPEQIVRGFSSEDEAGEHDPCHVWMPDGAGLDFNHHAVNGVDQARAEFVSAACNAMLDRLAAAPKQSQEGG